MDSGASELGVRARALADQARRQGRTVLLEHEAYHLLHAAGFDVPVSVVLDGPGAVPDLGDFSGDQVVVKLLSPELLHRTEVGGVRVVAREPHVVVRAVEEMLREASDPGAQVLLQEFVPHSLEPGAELLLSIRWSPEFGVVVTLALGGVNAEVLGDLCGSAATVRVWSGSRTVGELEADLSSGALASLITGSVRNRAPRVEPRGVAEAVARLLSLAAAVLPDPMLEVEINPLVFREGRPLCLDGLVRLAPADAEPGGRPARVPKHDAMGALLAPRSVAVVGASSRGMNPARVILRNLLAAGLPAHAVQVVKAGEAALEGCRCVPHVEALDPVDVLVVGVGADDVPDILSMAVERGLTKAVILISGGLGEGGHGEERARRLQALLARPEAPGVNGGNCLGIRSVPGRSDTLFIPPSKLGFPSGSPHPVALVSQSGAFAIARCSALPWLNPRHLVTVGNQLDITVGDWVEHFVDDADLRVVACYVEGFRPGDGTRFLAAARAHRAAGRIVILYRAGRTPQGADAMASHTASMAGDYRVTRALAEAEGVLVADSARDFSDLLNLAVSLADRDVAGHRVGLLSNAGFECVAMADRLGVLVAPPLHADTVARVQAILTGARLDGIVAPRNPLDVTPILGDAGFAAATGAVVEDPGVDVAVVGCVPLTPALQTLAGDHADDLEAEGSLASGLSALWRGSQKAWVTAVDGGPRYDALARVLQDAGIPVLRQADRAVELLGRYVAARLRPPRGR